jgi:cytochrome c oxidase subunit 2
MAATEATVSADAQRREPNHGLRIFLIWLPVALAADLLIWFVWGPHLPPGDMSSSASSQQFDIRVMAVMAAPVMAFVLVYAGYALVVWRHREGDVEDGPPIK